MEKTRLTGRVTGFDPIPRLAHIFALALALFIAPGAWAAVPTPTVVWDGDFGTSVKTGTDGKTYTLVLPSGSESWIQADGTLKIGSGTQGAYINLQDGETYNLAQGTKISVLMEYENATALSVVASPIYLQADAYFGLKTKASSLEVVGDSWGVTYPTSGNTVTTMPAAGNMLMVYPQGSGNMKIYSAATRSGLSASSSGGEITGLLFSNKRLQKIGIGGCFTSGETKGLNNFENLIIKKVAVFASAITATDATEYFFPSEIQTINVSAADSIAVSEINNQIDANTYKSVKVVAEDGATITVDEAFNAKIQSVSSTGNITLSAESQPDASYFSAVDFDVKGCVKRSWLAPGVIGINFRSTQGTDTSVALDSRGTWSHMGGDKAGSSRNIWGDGVSSLNWSAATVYQKNSSTILDGWLDENGGKINISLSGIPYESYDVIVYMSTDSASAQFQPVAVNGTTYTWKDGATVAGTDYWGSPKYDAAVYGTNALRVNYLSGTLSIISGPAISGKRGSIAAIQVVPSECTLSLDGTATDWSTGAWKFGTKSASAPLDSANGYATINLSASTTLTIDETVAINKLVVQGSDDAVLTLVTGTGASFVASESVVVKGGVLKQGSASVLGATPSIAVEDGGTFDMNGLGVNASSSVHIAGAGASSWPWALTSSSGAGGAILGGLYLDANATIGGANELKVGKTQAGYQCYLQGFTLTKTGAGAFTGTNMNTPGTGTIEVQGGAMSVNQWNNLNNAGGETTVILNTGTSLANGTDRIVPMSALGLYGGTLSTASKAFKVNTAFRGAGETANLAFGNGASAWLTGNLTVTATMTLDGSITFIKDQEAASDVVVTPAVLTAPSGTITIGSGVIFNVGTSRPTATITVQNGGALTVKQQRENDIIELSASAQPNSVVLYDASGNEVANPRVLFSNGKLTVMESKSTLEANGTTAFDTAENWINTLKPEDNGDVVIRLGGDAEITVADTYTFGSLIITGSGVVTFSGAGSISAANISVQNGATFTRNANISATTGIDLDSGTVLRLNGVTESAAISGAGAVETYGVVVLASVNSMTGGITVKPGSSLSTSAEPAWENASTKAKCNTGFGPYNKDSAYSAQSRLVVEDGGCVDICNVANKDTGVALTIAGKGILNAGVYSGAVRYSGSGAIGNNSRQISSLSLTADAMIDIGLGYGLVHSGHSAAYLNLAGHTLTMRGTGTVPMVRVTATAGNLVLDGATLQLSNYASNFAGVNIVAKGCATINLATAPSALGSLTLKPSATGTTASAWNLPAGCVPSLDTSNVDPSRLSVGDVLPLFTAPQATTLTAETISVKAGGRYATSISGNTVTATVKAGTPVNFIHYDFADGTGQAADTTYNHGTYNGKTRVPSRNGKAMLVNSSNTPYHSSNSSNKSPFYTGEMTVMALVKAGEANNTILWNLGQASVGGVALLARDATTFTLVSWDGDVNGSDVVSVTGVDVIGKWHLVTVVANASGTTLYVDNVSATVDAVLPSSINQCGQFGSIHGNKKNYNFVTSVGYLLDDWRVYDAALTEEEVAALKATLLIPGTTFTVY